MSVINTNVKALSAQESMRSSNLNMSQAMERLSTGKKINSAKDDAAGLAITNRMTVQIRGMAKAVQNTNDAISMTQTAEGAMSNIAEILQRVRELAVQSASGTNNDSDRNSLQLEVAQLQQQIQNIATGTNHNNIKLLDGGAQNITIQTGVTGAETMKIGFDSMQTKDIGIGSKSTITSVGGTYASGGNFDALSASSLYLNGVAVGPSLATDDNASSSNGAASSISKAAAINRVSSISGVYARASVNNVSGQTMVASATSGTVTINGITTDSIYASTDLSISRKNAVLVINAKTSLTGVVALDTGDDLLGVTLRSLDGRNITTGTFTGAGGNSSIGIASANTFVGSYDLFTLNGSDVNVSFSEGLVGVEAEKRSGLRNGTYKSDTALATTFIRAAAAAGTAPSDSTTGVVDGKTMTINGVAIGGALTTDDTASDVTVTSSTRAASAIAIAATINRATGQTGVAATAAPNVLRGYGFTSVASSTTLFLNGQSITVNSNTRNGVVDSINSASGRTGVTASAWGDGVQLTAADGRNISINSTAANTAFGLNGVTIGTASTAGGGITYYSQVTLSSANKFTLASGANGVTNFELLGFRQGTFGGNDNGMKINQINISTANGATMALAAIDAAIGTVSNAQARSGAINNRLDAVVNNLAEASQNIQASRS